MLHITHIKCPGIPILGHPSGGSSFDLIRLMAYMDNKKYVKKKEGKKKKKSSSPDLNLSHAAARLLVHREFRKGSLPGFVQRGGDQKAAEFISC